MLKTFQNYFFMQSHVFGTDSANSSAVSHWFSQSKYGTLQRQNTGTTQHRGKDVV